jgi:hypothetical protein
VVTTTLPVVAPLGMTAVRKVPLATLKLVAGMPLKVTAVVPVKPWPRICAALSVTPVGWRGGPALFYPSRTRTWGAPSFAVFAKGGYGDACRIAFSWMRLCVATRAPIAAILPLVTKAGARLAGARKNFDKPRRTRRGDAARNGAARGFDPT